MLEDHSYMKSSKLGPPFAVPAVFVILAVNLAVFVLVEINKAYNLHGSSVVLQYFALSTAGIGRGWIWQLLSFQFLHFGGLHFVMNMFGLFIFGRAVEDVIGKKDFYLLYLGSGVVGGLMQLLLGLLFPMQFGVPVMGASAGVFGLVAAYAILNPEKEILLFFVLPIRARHFLWIAGGISIFYILVPADPGIAHGAHLGGLLGGVAYIRWIIQSGMSLTGWQPFANRRPRGLVSLRFSKSKSCQKPDPPETLDASSTDFISQEVDPILDKISAHGMQSLTPSERKILEAARSKMERR